MKKLTLYFIGVICLCFLLPAILTDPFVQVRKVESSDFSHVDEKSEPSTFLTIKLLHTSTNAIEEISLEKYLYGVVSAEMPANYETEALKAQAIVARTYTLYTAKNSAGKHGEATICDSSGCCQAWISKEDRLARWDEAKREEYWNKIVDAVDSTKGMIITYEGEPINAFFHSNSGGITEAPIDVWRGKWISVSSGSINRWRRCVFTICIRGNTYKRRSCGKDKTKSS